MQHLLFLLFCISILSCGTTSREQTIDFYVDSGNGFVKSKNIAGVDYKVSYHPSELTLLTNLEKKNYTQKEVDELRERYGNGGYFNLQMTANESNQQGIDRITLLNKYYTQHSFDASNISLVTESKTIPVSYFHVERAYELSQRVNILIGFDEVLVSNQKYKLLYKDELINKGGLSFQFELKDGPICSDNIDCINNYKK